MFIISLISFRTGLRHYSDKTYQNSNMIWDTFANGHTCMLSNNSRRWHCSLSGEWLSWQLGGVANKQYLLHNQCTVNLPTSNNQQPKSILALSSVCVQSMWHRCTSNKQKQQPISNTNTPYLYIQRATVVSQTSKSNNQKPLLHLLVPFILASLPQILKFISQLNFSNAFLDWISQLNFWNCISQLNISAQFLKCFSQLKYQ